MILVPLSPSLDAVVVQCKVQFVLQPALSLSLILELSLVIRNSSMSATVAEAWFTAHNTAPPFTRCHRHIDSTLQ